MTTPYDIARDPTVRRSFAGLRQAAGLVGAVQIRGTATLGGALCSGLRCQFRDQSSFWRRTLGPCLTAGGESCHAAGGQRCAATVACDLPPALAALGGMVQIRGPESTRRAPVESLYTGDGLAHLALDRGEIVTGVLLPWPVAESLSAYGKARLRRAVDRPLVGVALAAEISAEGELLALRIAVCGNGPRVGLVEGLEPFLGARFEERVGESIGRVVARAFHPSPAIRIDASWRRHIAGALTSRGLAEVAASHDLRPRRLPTRTPSVDVGAQARRG